jgi:hypothetical protein
LSSAVQSCMKLKMALLAVVNAAEIDALAKYLYG